MPHRLSRFSAKLGLLALAMLSFAASCTQTPSADWHTKLASCPTEAELGRLAAWDRLELRVYGQPEMTGEYEVSPSGTISFPRLGRVQVEGMRCDQVEEELSRRLAESLLVDPSVTCINREVKRTSITVDGEVRSPGVVEFHPGLMLTDAIAYSKGLSTRADGNAVVIIRKLGSGGTDSIVVPYGDIVESGAPNVCMHPGDLVFVPQTVF